MKHTQPAMPMPHVNGCDCKKWKRKFMETEHVRRHQIRKMEDEMCDFSDIITEYESTISALKAELNHSRTMRTTQKKVILQLQGIMEESGIPVKRTMVSLSNCRAKDDEICPLSLAPINKSPIPLCEDETPSTLVLNQVKPDHKCAELACGHRFNSLWLIYYFVERSTFRCPVCRAGKEEFRFQRKELPPGAQLMLEMVKEIQDNLKKKKTAQSN
jgi:hypothetical protein